ncbi:nucleoside-diphosphate sugar epimerase/dehydratase [Paracoccaceae bacterium Fryx2]|nr:nucleoside-diphosphate sugar epimerase/dehydratase [Paracoccaceae bacterium Fryx2]
MLWFRGVLFAFVDRLTRPQKRGLLMLVDVIMAPLALFLTCSLVYNSLFPEYMLLRMWPFFPAVSVAAAIMSIALGIPRIKLNAYEAVAILKTGAFALLVMVAFAVMTRVSNVYFSGGGIILFGLLLFLLSFAIRVILLYGLLWVLRLGQPRKRVLIYGAGTTGTQLVAALREHHSIMPVAFLDDNAALHSTIVVGLRVFPPGKIESIVQDRDIDRVILAMPSLSPPKLAQIARRLQNLGLEVNALPSFAQLIGVEELIDTLTPMVPGDFLGRQQVGESLPQGTEAYIGRSVLVTGAGGSVGSELCRQILACRPRRLVMFEVSEIALYTIDRELRDRAEDAGVELIPVLGSVTDSRMARMVMVDHDVNVVFHAAAYKHVPLVESNPIAGLANNVLGTKTLAGAADECGVERFILISTDKAVRPTNIMGASKRLAELVVQDLAKRSRNTVFSMVRFGNVLGSSGSVIPLFKDQIARGGPVTLTHEDVTRYFMTISEAARLVLLAGSFAHAGGPRGGDVFVLDMGKAVKIRDLAEQMIHAANYTVRDAANPDGDIEIQVIGLRPGEKLHEELLIGKGLLTTPHSKILRAQESSLSELEMASALRALRSAIAVGDAAAACAVVHDWVEGYQRPEKVAAAQ